MGLYLYDDSLIQKLKYWCEKTDITVYGPDETRQLFETLADKNNDNPIKLPLIVLSRSGGYTIKNPNKKPTTYSGYTAAREARTALQLMMIPIEISYRLDVYTRFLKEADMYIRNLIFNIVNYPTLSVTVPYNNSNFKHNANIRIVSDVMDSSNSSPRLFAGQFTHLAINLSIDDAYIWDLRVMNNLTIDDENVLYVQNPDQETFTKETI